MHLQHLPGDLLGLPSEDLKLLTNPETWAKRSLFLPQRLSDFDPASGEVSEERSKQNTAGIKSVCDSLDAEERRLLVDRLESAVTPFAPHVRVLDALGAAQESKSTFVVASVEPCFLGPRLSDLLGVMQAIRLACELSGYHKEPVLPLVWVSEDLSATDERCAASLLGPNHDRLQLSALDLQAPDRPKRISEIVVESDRRPLLRAQLRQLFVREPFRDEAFATLLPHEGETLSAVTRRTLLTLFGAEGLIVCGPSDFRSDLAHELSGRVDRGREVLARLPSDTTICTDAKTGEALLCGGEGYRRPNEPGSRTGIELAAEIVEDPERFYAGPKLEAALVRRVLPARAWVGDRRTVASEHNLADSSDPSRRRTAWVPRWEASWLFPQDVEALERLERTAEQAVSALHTTWEPVTHDIDSILREQLSPSRASLKDLLSHFRKQSEGLVALDPTLKPLLRRQTRHAERMLETFLERAERALRNRGGTRERYERRLAGALRPLKKPAAEVDGPILPLARYGPAVFREAQGEIETFTFEHVLIFPE